MRLVAPAVFALAWLIVWGRLGLPFWPLWVTAAAVLTLAGIGSGRWQNPAIVLAAYLGMRINIETLPQNVHETVGGTIWLCAGAALLYRGNHLAAVFAAASGLVYPVALTFGVRIEYLGLTPILADAMAVLAMASLWGDGGGVDHHTNRNRARPRIRDLGHPAGLASRTASDPHDHGADRSTQQLTPCRTPSRP